LLYGYAFIFLPLLGNIGKCGTPYNTYLNFTGKKKKFLSYPLALPSDYETLYFRKGAHKYLKLLGLFRAFLFVCFTYRIAGVACVQDYPSQKIKQFEKITTTKKTTSKFKLSSKHI